MGFKKSDVRMLIHSFNGIGAGSVR